MLIHTLEWFDEANQVWRRQIILHSKLEILREYDRLCKLDANGIYKHNRKWRYALYTLSKTENLK